MHVHGALQSAVAAVADTRRPLRQAAGSRCANFRPYYCSPNIYCSPRPRRSIWRPPSPHAIKQQQNDSRTRTHPEGEQTRRSRCLAATRAATVVPIAARHPAGARRAPPTHGHGRLDRRHHIAQTPAHAPPLPTPSEPPVRRLSVVAPRSAGVAAGRCRHAVGLRVRRGIHGADLAHDRALLHAVEERLPQQILLVHLCNSSVVNFSFESTAPGS